MLVSPVAVQTLDKVATAEQQWGGGLQKALNMLLSINMFFLSLLRANMFKTKEPQLKNNWMQKA